ncbi:hypothetical protein L915_08321 [Phytophthora nicotianae]|uniref:BED-type domain-containing protein n=2 Tax=Phytophthora nicotianae TaxID=4792 RepID=W2GW47_PHYNI|nr:hypothetical protein L915_08321 [Phytophthora nicotianae]
MAGKGRPSCPEVRHFTLLKELGKAPGSYTYRECSFCRAAYNNDVTTDPPKVRVGRPRNYLRHLAYCQYYKAARLTKSSINSTPVHSTEEPIASVTGPVPMMPSGRASSPVSSVEDTPTGALQPRAPNPSSQQPQGRSSARFAGESRARRVLVLDKRQAASPTRPLQNMKRLKPASGKKMKQKRRLPKAEVKQSECSLLEMHADNHLADRFIENESTLGFLELICPGIAAILPSRRSLSNRILK